MPSDLTNNTPQSARAISLTGGTPLIATGELSKAPSGDLVDYYRFTSSTDSNLNVAITGLTGNARLKVFRQAADGSLGTELVNNAIAGNTTSSTSSNTNGLSESLIFNGLTAGTYLIQVDLDTTETVGANYTLQALASADGKESTVLWRAPGTAPLYFWKMNGSDYQQTLYPGDLTGFEVVGTGDFDGDKTSDVLLRQTTPAGVDSIFIIGLMNPDNTLRSQAQLVAKNGTSALPSSFIVAGVEDLNGDSKADIIFRNTTPGLEYLFIWTMDGTNNVTQDAYTQSLDGYDIVGFGDFNGDGKKDIAWRNTRLGGSAVAIWLMDGGTQLATGVIDQPMPANFKLVGIKNSNATIGGLATSPQADKTDDLYWYDSNTGQASIWTMDGITTKGRDNIAGPIPLQYFIAGIEDVNGDGNGDFVWRTEQDVRTAAGNLLTGAVGIWLMDGPRAFKGGAAGVNFAERSIPGDYYAAGFGDFNGDGTSDILWRNRFGTPIPGTLYDSAAVWLMGGGTGTTSKAELFLMNPGIPSTPLDVNQVRRLPAAFKVPAILTNQYSKQDQSTAGSTYAKAFNIGTLNGEGDYQDSVLGATGDYFKFKLDQSALASIDLFDKFGSTTALTTAKFELYQETTGADGTTVQTLVPSFTSGKTLGKGVYYIKVTSTASLTTKVNYDLKVKGRPIVVNLLGAGLDVLNAGAPVTNINLADVGATFPSTVKTPLTLQYKITNQLTSDSGPVTVKFYASRNTSLDVKANAADVTANSPTDVLIGTTTVATVAANSTFTGTTGANEVALPPGDNTFWTTDKNYTIGMVIDPGALVSETVETDNYNQGLAKDLNSILITNTQVPDLLLTKITTTSGGTLTKGGTVAVSYDATNQGKRATGAISQDVPLNFYLSKSPTLDVNQALVLASSSSFVPGVNIGPNQTVPGNVTITIPGANDPYWTDITPGTTLYITAFIDPGNRFLESDEDNNKNQGIGKDVLQFTV